MVVTLPQPGHGGGLGRRALGSREGSPAVGGSGDGGEGGWHSGRGSVVPMGAFTRVVLHCGGGGLLGKFSLSTSEGDRNAGASVCRIRGVMQRVGSCEGGQATGEEAGAVRRRGLETKNHATQLPVEYGPPGRSIPSSGPVPSRRSVHTPPPDITVRTTWPNNALTAPVPSASSSSGGLAAAAGQWPDKEGLSHGGKPYKEGIPHRRCNGVTFEGKICALCNAIRTRTGQACRTIIPQEWSTGMEDLVRSPNPPPWAPPYWPSAQEGGRSAVMVRCKHPC